MKTIAYFIFLMTLSVCGFSQASIFFSKIVHDFDKIEENSEAKCVFNFKNNGPGELKIISIKASCGCITASCPKMTLNSGESSEINVTYNSKNRPGAFNKTVTVTTNSSPESTILNIKGTAVPANEIKVNASNQNNNTSSTNTSQGTQNNITVQSNSSNSPAVLLKSNNHVITYSFSGDNIIFILEDINDQDNTLWNVGGERGFCWDISTICCSQRRNLSQGNRAEWAHYGQDASLIEVDMDLNNKMDNRDKGFYISKKEGANAHWLTDDFYFLSSDSRDQGFGMGNIPIKESKADANSKWVKSQFSSKEHPIFTYTIPLQEIMDFEKMKINIRFIFLRSSLRNTKNFAEELTKKPNPPSDCRHYYYPEQDVCSNSPKFFTIDLFNTTNEIVLNMKKKLENEKVKQATAEEDASLISKLYTAEAMKKATSTLPKYDGVYIKLKNSTYVEVLKQNCYYSLTRDASKGKGFMSGEIQRMVRKQGLTPYYKQKVFDTLRIVQIQKSDYVNFSVVASASLKKDIDFLSLHPVKLYPLYPLTGGTMYLISIPDGDKIEGMLEGINIYWFDSKLTFDRTPGESWSYTYNLNTPLDLGYYGLWLNRNIWIFQIIPDKTKTNKSANTGKSNTDKTKNTKKK
ncbi:MAG: hypothetical protein A2275_05245 [Bacteroidetes bacterium RIFOXYA12_FULL_35_11]|nr:MAG: hypothetical protein A2X01_18490 [Bacteroidetes bacterium GWF2_35_48]OFY74311.1 MAG: hypothetical protein A2275_05245 [Bacteroidetes bacterium RIFOXYA12_FULL_35_11]